MPSIERMVVQRVDSRRHELALGQLGTQVLGDRDMGEPK